MFIEARNIARRDVLVACAAHAGVDPQAFAVLHDADAGAAGLASDVQERRRLAVRHFPTVLISTPAAPRPRLLSAGAQQFSAVEPALRSRWG